MYYNSAELQSLIQARDVRDDITTLKKDLKQEMTVSNYVSFKYLPLALLSNVGLLHIYNRLPI